MVWIMCVLITISFLVCFVFGAILIGDLMTLDRYKMYCTVRYLRSFYERKYDEKYQEHKKNVRYFFAWLVILIMNLITGYSLL
jgi:hypothetical protein